MRVRAERLLADIEALAGFGVTNDGGVDRPTFSPADTEAKAWLAERCRDAGLSVRGDDIGNLFVGLDRSPDGASAAAAPAVWTGSHLDSVPNGGRLDGVYGVLAGIECLRVLAEHEVPLARPVEVVAFADEEGCYQGFLGSKAVAGVISADELAELTGRDGTPLPDALARIGSTPERAAACAVDPADVAAFVELHIEQGPVLEEEAVDIGVVTEIVQVVRGTARFVGRADHAGTTPMNLRRDASRGAGAFLAELARVPEVAGSTDGVATCGRMDLLPGAPNIVPAEARLVLDLRDRAGGVARLQSGVEELADRSARPYGLDVEVAWQAPTAGARLDAALGDLVAKAATELGCSYRHMVSGAGHDTQVLAPLVPSAMIFVPSQNGRSHSPLEHTDPDRLAAGADVLLRVLAELATRPQ
ncbi:MAG: Zn-dependent hydrolase [Actinomycetota bacterium]|nr:Zn-dependent hydrolase [Actinomycetota bacterium]